LKSPGFQFELMKIVSGLLLILAAASVQAESDSQIKQSARTCEEPVGSIVASEGAVSFKSHQANQWLPVSGDMLLCAGDVVRSLQNGKATLLLDADETLVRLDRNTSLALPKTEANSFFIDLYQGALNFLSRTARELSVRTPYVNATVEGTEFLVSVNKDLQNTTVSVFEGKVRVSNDLGELLLATGSRSH